MLYYIYGDNSRYLKYTKLINKLKKEFNTDEIITFPGLIENVNDFYSELKSNSLFDNHKIFAIKQFENIDYKNFYSFLKSFNLNNLLNNKSLVIVQEIDEKKTTDKNFAEKMIKLDGHNIKAQNSIDDISKFILKSINIPEMDAKKIAKMYENDFFRLEQEIKKLSLMFEDEEITFDDIKSHLLIESDNNYFESIENILNGKTSDINEDNVLGLIAALNKEMINIFLLHIYTLPNQYNSFVSSYTDDLKSIFSNAHPYAIFKKNVFKNIYSKKEILHILDELNDVEVKLKTGIYDKSISVDVVKSLFNKKRDS